MSGCKQLFCQYKGLAIAVSLLLLGACSSPVQSPIQACQSVTEALLDFTLPPADKVAISEQEIRGERIVTHLEFVHSAGNDPVNVVCVFAIDRYHEIQAQYPYSTVPTRMAVNSQQITEAELLRAIEKSGLAVHAR